MRRGRLIVAALVFVRAVQAEPLAEEAAEVPVDTVPAEPPPVEPAVDALTQLQTEAEERRQRALRLYDQGNFSAARAEFERAHELVPSFRLLYNLGVVSLALDDSAAAFEYFERYLREGGSAVSPEMKAAVERQLRDLAAHVTMLEIVVDIPGAAVIVDDRFVGTAPLPNAVRVSAGSRRISARTADRAAARRVVLAGGTRSRLVLRLSKPGERLKHPPVSSPRTAVWLAWGSTAILTGVAVFSGLQALAAQREYEQLLERPSTREELDQQDAKTLRWSVATDVIAVASLAAGGYSLYLTLRSSSGTARPAPGTVGLRLLPGGVALGAGF